MGHSGEDPTIESPVFPGFRSQRPRAGEVDPERVFPPAGRYAILALVSRRRTGSESGNPDGLQTSRGSLWEATCGL